jgi:catechol 2,3-dioxygenase-like lactoylglutathione lyase family enzyme
VELYESTDAAEDAGISAYLGGMADNRRRAAQQVRPGPSRRKGQTSAMPLSIDHVVIAVRDLAQASADYATAGFTVTPGGWHTGGATHNALISFADGSYFELIAFAEPDREQPHKWWPRFAKGEGTVDFAMLSTDLGAEAERLQTVGLTVEGPVDGGRERPDGAKLAWRSLTLGTGIPLPFVIEDVTARDLRVPPAPATEHSLGVTGVSGLVMLVPDLEAASRAYRALLGVEGEPVEASIAGVRAVRRFTFGEQWIDLAQPEEVAKQLWRHIEDHVAGPYEIILATETPGHAPMTPELAHGAHIRFDSPE